MKKCLLFFALAIFTASGAQAAEKAVQVFNHCSPGTVYIYQALWLDQSALSNPHLFERMLEHGKDSEEGKEQDDILIEEDEGVLNTYLPISSGSGFFITEKGDIITNEHVIKKPENWAEMKSKLRKGIIKNLVYKLPSDDFTSKEKSILAADISKLINNAEIRFVTRIANKENIETTVVAFDEELDLALLKLKSSPQKNPIKPLSISEDNDPQVGQDVIAIGYPIPSSLNFLKDFQPTMTKGSISAVRNDNWGIQHTASINPGNSGGPLVNLSGEVIGVNVGEMRNANDMYFSIPGSRLKSWLMDQGQSQLLVQNRKGALGLGVEYPTDSRGRVIISSDFAIRGGEGLKIYIDGRYRGTTPMLITDLSAGTHKIEIRNDLVHHSASLYVNNNASNAITEYQPKYEPYYGKLVVESTPNNAKVSLNGVFEGATPLIVRKLPVGEQTIKIEAPGHAPHEETVLIKKNKKTTHSIELSPLFIIKLEGLEKNQPFFLRKVGGEWTKHRSSQAEVGRGSYEIKVEKQFHKDFVQTVTVSKSDVVVTYEPEAGTATITLVGFQSDSVFTLSGEPLELPAGDKPTVTIPAGKHTLRIETAEKIPMESKFSINTDEELIFKPKYENDPQLLMSDHTKLKNAGAAVMSVGLGLTIIAGVLNVNEVSSKIAPDYAAYEKTRMATAGTAWASGAVSLSGAITMLTGIGRENKVKKSMTGFKDGVVKIKPVRPMKKAETAQKGEEKEAQES